MIQAHILLILSFFDVCGFNSGSSKVSKNVFSVYFIYLIHVVIVILATLFISYLAIEYYSSINMIEATSEFLQYFTALCSYWLIIVDSFVHRQAHKEFWNILYRIDTRFCDQQNLSLRTFMWKFIQFFTTTNTILVVRLVLGTVELTIDIVYSLLFQMCQLRIFYYLFCLEVIQYQLTAIENRLEQHVLNGLITNS